MSAAVHLIAVVVVIGAPIGEAIDEARRRYEPTEGKLPAHITVLPPINVDDDALPAVVAHLESVAAHTASFDIRLRGTDTFRPRSRVVFIAVTDGLVELGRLEAAVRSGDLAREHRFSYHPHVTVAHNVAEDVLDAAYTDLARFDELVSVQSFGLYEHRGRRWEQVREFALSGSRT